MTTSSKQDVVDELKPQRMMPRPGKIHGSKHCCHVLNLISAFIARLWNAPENQDLVNEFMENELCRVCALNEDPRALEYFTTYMVVRIFPNSSSRGMGF